MVRVFGFNIPDGYKGLIHLPGTGRAVYWTGRLAIGIRHVRPTPDRGRMAEHIQIIYTDTSLVARAERRVQAALRGFSRLTTFSRYIAKTNK